MKEENEEYLQAARGDLENSRCSWRYVVYTMWYHFNPWSTAQDGKY